jgi:hypothetical protein
MESVPVPVPVPVPLLPALRLEPALLADLLPIDLLPTNQNATTIFVT